MRWWQISKRDKELDRELRADLELEEEEQRERGMPPREARYAARRALGNSALIKEKTHEAWGWAPIERFVQDLHYGVRQLIRNPGFTAMAVTTLALGIGVNTTIFSSFSAILLRKPPVTNPDTLCAVSSKKLVNGSDLIRASAPDFESWQKQNDVFDQMAAVETGRSFTITGRFEPEQVVGDRVSTGFFSVIGVKPILGRPFLASEDKPGSNHEVILSTSLWRKRYDSDPGVLGQDLEINGKPHRIVGVMPPFAGITPGAQPQLWTPLVFNPQDLSLPARANHYINLVLGRLKAGVTIKQAQTEMDSIAQRLAQVYPTTNKNWGVTVLTLQEYNIRYLDVRNAMLLIMTAVGLVLLIACANVAGLLLTRGACRSHELAVRSALGASRGRILRQMLTESLLIGTAGGVTGLLLSFWGIRLLRAGFDFNEMGRQMGTGLRIDGPTLVFTLVITLLTTVVFGLLPAIRSSKAPPRSALSQTGRTSSAGSGSTRFRRILVAGEVAFAVILLAAAGVLLRETVREISEPNGFNPHHLLIADLDVSSARYKQLEARAALFEEVTEKLNALPEVQDATVDSCFPLGCGFGTSFNVMGQPTQPLSRQRPRAGFFVVGPEYFRTMQIPVLRGRGFSVDDNTDQPVVAIVSQEFARRFFPRGDAIGKEIEANDGNHRWAEIVGIVGDVNHYVGQLHPQPQIYECYLQIPVKAFSRMELVVRSRVSDAVLAPVIRRTVWSVDKTQPASMVTMRDLIDDNVGGNKLLVGLMALFGCLAVGLAGVGLYGVVAYFVAQRTREIGIRVALGAKKGDVFGLILREGGVLTGIGSVIGLVPALLLPRLFTGLFSGFAPQGPGLIAAAALIVSVVSCVAIYIPACRAMNVDPMVALRSE